MKVFNLIKFFLLICSPAWLVVASLPSWPSLSSTGTGVGLSGLIPWLGLSPFDMSKAGKRMLDSSDDIAATLSAHQLIVRAGFEYENYWALADDGYMTQLIRIINPLADPTYLKRPVIVQHGQTANNRNFVLQSNSQHFPMRWPRPGAVSGGAGGFFGQDNDNDNDGGDDGATDNVNNNGFNFIGDFFAANGHDDRATSQSSNRSLAFMLANNGYDVWLASTRGSDDNNRGFLGSQVAAERVAHSSKRLVQNRKNMTMGEADWLADRTARSYWSFTLDDQIAHELPSQIATVLNVTGAEKVILTGYSNTCLTTLAMLSTRPDIGRHVETFVAIAPVVYYSKLTGWFSWFMSDFMQLIPKQLDVSLFLSAEMARFLRKASMRACRQPPVRYTMCKYLLDMLFGRSSQFRTNLELPVFGATLRPTSWKCLAHHLQIVKSHRLAKFDYGPRHNKQIYGSPVPPEYKLEMIDENIRIGLVSGLQDVWANAATVDEVRSRLARPPQLDLVLQDYNHLDLMAAFDVDVAVNLPILRFLDEAQQGSNLSPSKTPAPMENPVETN